MERATRKYLIYKKILRSKNGVFLDGFKIFVATLDGFLDFFTLDFSNDP